MADIFSFLMISAMYENGGNTTQRLLDGHPELYSYPFESQLGTKYVADHLPSLYPLKYRWPVVPLHGSPAEDYELDRRGDAPTGRTRERSASGR